MMKPSPPQAAAFDECVPALLASTLRTLRDDLKFSRMTPVQSAVIPLFLSNKDVAVEACTGSGKTVAFLVPIVEILMRRDVDARAGVGAVVISPTRELARQTFDVCVHFCDHLKRGGFAEVRCMLAIGGESMRDQMAVVHKGVHIIVATVNRISSLHVFSNSY